MKKIILIALATVSVAASANVNTRKILDQYRKEALMEQTKTAVKEIKAKPNKKAAKLADEAQDDVTSNEVIRDIKNDKHAYDDVIEKVNVYLQNNPEKKEKLDKHYRTVIGHE